MVHAIKPASRSGGAAVAFGAGLLVVLLAPSSYADEAISRSADEAVRPNPDAVPLDEHSALMVGRHQLKLGVLAFEYGITRDISIGIDSPSWVAGAVTSLFAPNGHLKLAIVQVPTVVVSALVGGYYATFEDGGNIGHLISIPVSLFGSVPLSKRLWLHGELNYNWVRAVDDITVNTSEVKGSVAARTGQLGLMGAYHFTRVFAVVARARYQVYSSSLLVHSDPVIDPYTTADLQAEVRPNRRHPYMAVAGIALTWKHVGLVLACGYGTVFINGANVALPYLGVVPDATFWVSF